MTEKVSFASMNVQGLGDFKKRKDVFIFLREKKYNVYFIQDTHFTDKDAKLIRSQWGYECYFSNFNSQSRGVAILINNNFDYKFISKENDGNGNLLIVNCEICSKLFSLFCIYGPNRDSPTFYENIQNKLNNIDNYVILGGDFNLVINPSIDYYNYKTINNPKAREVVIQLMLENDLIDYWREQNLELKMYTWFKNNPVKKARLDFFLISNYLYTSVDDTAILPGYRTDHSLIVLTLDLIKFKKGNSYWKFNNSLLKDIQYVTEINELILTVKKQYTSTHQVNNTHPDLVSDADILLEINDQLFFETLLMEIRGKTIAYSSKKSKDQKEKIQNIEKEILKLQNLNLTDNSLLQAKQKELYEIRQTKLEGSLIRSRAKWILEGEKPTRYFCNLENRNFTSKLMNSIYSNSGQLLQDQDDILKETENHFKRLYSHKPTEKIDLENIIHENFKTKLSEKDKQSLEGILKYDELLCSLKKMSNFSAPGNSGFTAAFYKVFWSKIGYFLTRSINTAFEKGELSISQKQGVITCIPKGNKDKKQLKNWRPISLLNISYKIASSAIANRIKTVLNSIISEDQTGFIPDRFMGDNVRLIYDIMCYTEQNKCPSMLLLIDFATAFDSVSWKFMAQVLDFFNFGKDIKSWINMFYKDIQSCVTVNGHLSDWFYIHRGCRQGDPLSPYLFILCAEILAMLIKQNKDIRGIMVNDKEFIISQYADDTTLLLDGSEKSLVESINILKFYAKASGLHVNIDKTNAVWIGSMKNSPVELCPELNLNWEREAFKLLGVTFTINLHQIVNVNYNAKIDEIKNY